MYTPAQLAQACLAYYALKADTLDYSGHNNDATAVGSPTFIPGRFGNAISIAGTPGNGVQLPASAFTQTGQDFTLSLWVCLSSDEQVTNGWAVIAGGLACDNDNGLLAYQMTYSHSGQTYLINFGFEASLTPGVWTHLAVTFDQSQMLLTCYVNGVATMTYPGALVVGSAASMPFTGRPYIGYAGPTSDSTSTFNGAIGDVLLFNLAIDEETLDLLDGTVTFDIPSSASPEAFPWLFAAAVVLFIGLVIINLPTRQPTIVGQLETEPSAPQPYSPSAAAQKIMQIAGTPLSQNPLQFTRAQAGIPPFAKVKVDIGGCGRYLYADGSDVIACGFSDAININCVSTTGSDTKPPNQPIPNLLLIGQVGPMSCNPLATYPFANDTVDYVTIQNAPLSNTAVSEIARILKPGGEVGLWLDTTEPSVVAQITALANLLGYQQQSCTGLYEDLDEMVLAYRALLAAGYTNAKRFPTKKIRLYPAA